MVDDTPANLAVVGDYLNKQGYQVMVALTGETGLSLAQQANPDLILLDVLLPGIDGFETCRRLKADERTREIPVIFMTIVARTEDKVRGFEAGGVDYITKPFQQEEVLARVTSHLRIRALTQELAIARNKAQQYLDIAGVILVAINTNWQVTMINQKGCEVLGCTTDEIIGKDWFQTFVPENIRQNVIQSFHQLMAGEIEQFRYFENPILTSGGEERLIAWNNVLLKDDTGKIVGTISSGEDITERRQMEQTLQESDFLFKKAQELGKIGGWDWNTATNMSTWTEQVYHIHEIPLTEPPADLVAKSLECYRPEDRPIIFAAFTNCIEKGIPYDLEFPFTGYRGTDKWIRTAAIPQFEGDKVMHVYGYIMDITEHKRAEEQIRKLNHDLQNRAIALASVNQELDAFAYSVSHDLRAPLRHIDGFLELLRTRMADSLDESSQHYMNNISDAAKRMGILIDELLSFSRMGRNEISKAQVDLDELVQDVILEFRPETEGRDIQWKISPLPLVTGDRTMLRMVLVNLISNAVKFTRSRPQTEIEIGWIPGHEAETIVFVRDNGVGFDMQYADKLFGVFQRLHRVDEFEGTGIGLANVRQVINRHGGKTWAEAEVDHGATFYFSLPRFTPRGNGDPSK
jgi:PAS domain S-box-containing protein